ncbi:hypothetical protein MA04_01746 [Alcanivorax balearicus MACL04]|uniref:Ubiquinone biosynthesis accessory factor UbiT n=1 Tax=Alloalcanivorax balearicus MACL04 TaxID=1177182 RepID=A0ABT2QY42_9GAMM|nr:SCP2 sterol-binding domain-containing protein [Alloalcanivorax balearicus]MCU5782446.1 hypothetical protein [Alloalcanivorax balearicus MACL04]
MRFPLTPFGPPSPLAVFRHIDAHAPLLLKRPFLEPLMNRLLAEPLAAGEFEPLQGRHLTLDLADGAPRFTVTLQANRLRLSERPGEACIRGGWREFLQLLGREQDPDTLFFQRRLLVEGDTELGLWVKNLLDGLDQGGWPEPVREGLRLLARGLC